MTREERDDAIKFFEEVAKKEVDNAKYSKLAIEALKQEPKTGKWISTETKGVRYAFWCRYKCPLCGGLSAHTNFCPNCGAKMESEDKG